MVITLPRRALFLVSFLLLLRAAKAANNFMVPGNDTGISFPNGLLGNWYDVYADRAKDVFLLLTSTGIYQMDFARTTIVASSAFGCCVGNDPTGRRFYTDIANNTDYIYVTPDFTAPYHVYRFTITDVTTPTVYNLTRIANPYQMALDPSRNLGFAVAQGNQYVEIFDLLTMSFVTTFNYTQGKYPWFDSSLPGGWGIALDSTRGLLYVGVDCDSPTPGIVWQYTIANLSHIAYVDNAVWGSEPCFNLGFVEVADGRAWFFEDDAGWIGGFDRTDLSWGSDYSVATVSLLRSLEYDPSLHTAYFLDHGANGVPTYTGQVFRGCLLDPGNIVHEVVPWQKYGRTDDLCGSYLDTSMGVLYAVSCSAAVYTISITNGTDCPQMPRAVPACPSSAAALGNALLSVWAFFFPNL